MGMLDDMLTLINRLGWAEYITMQCISYDRLMIEFLSSLHVDWDGTFAGHEVVISFHMFNVDHRMNLRMFNELLKLPVVDGHLEMCPPCGAPAPRG